MQRGSQEKCRILNIKGKDETHTGFWGLAELHVLLRRNPYRINYSEISAFLQERNSPVKPHRRAAL